MADLDDFFAKKDKKKPKPRKFTPEEVAKKLEEAEKKQQERERREEQKRKQELEEQLEIDDPSLKKEPADEWHDEEEHHVDLSDLNIQQLPQPEEEKPDKDSGELDADGNPTNQPTGPWNKNKPARDPSPDDAAEESETGPESAPAASTAAAAVVAGTGAAAAASSAGGAGGGGYVPPHKRNQPASAGTPLAPVRLSAMGRGGRRSRAPDISSDEAFPTLGAAVDDSAKGAWGQQKSKSGAAFQKARGHGGSQDVRLQSSKINLGNQFDALRLNDASY